MPRECKSREQILEIAHKQKVQFVRFQFTDLLGILKALTIPVSKLAEALEDNLWFDGSSISGFTGIQQSDMMLKPDLSTFEIIPWTKIESGADPELVTARIICDVLNPDGSPFAGCPRNILKNQLSRLEKLGMIYKVGPELEFFLFKNNPDGSMSPSIHDTGGYFDQATDKGAAIRKKMVGAMMEMGLEIEALHHEVAPAQHEINFRFSDALTTADNAMTLKFVIKAIAHNHGLHATFMAKPIAGINGSGMHVHQSLFAGNENVFYDEISSDKLSEQAKKFIAGQLSHIKGMNLILNPTVNSYKRLVAGYEAPVYIAWGETNRSALIRVPRLTPGKEKGARFELRCADPTANPYLVFAAMLAAGMDGIEKNLEAPAKVSDDLFHKSLAEIKNMGIECLPANLGEAISEFTNNSVIRKAIGEHAAEKLLEIKQAEYSAYSTYVSQWEIDQYLEKY